LGSTFADTIAQRLFELLPRHPPKRMIAYRDRYEHHLIMLVSDSEREATEPLLTAFFADPDRSGSFFNCSADEAKSAMLHRFGAASAMARYYRRHGHVRRRTPSRR